MLAKEGGGVFEAVKTVGGDLEAVREVPGRDQYVFLHRKAGGLSVPEDSGMATKSTWPHPETAMGARHTIETGRGRPGVEQ